VAIIDFGKLQCIGSTGFLRDTYCAGTSLEIAFDKEHNLDDFDQFLDLNEIGHEKNQIKSDKFCYIVKNKRDVHTILEKFEESNVKSTYNIRDYNVSQPKLDDIFFRIIKKNRPDQQQDALANAMKAETAGEPSMWTQFLCNISKNFN
jgi:hypothetical protein